VDTTTPPYLKFPDLPPIQLLLGDSVTRYSKADLPKKTPVVFILFNPDCSHCQEMTSEMVGHKDQLSGIHIVMITLNSVSEMNAFVEKYALKEMPNLITGKDIYYLMPSFYNIKSLPFMAAYDKKGRLIKGLTGFPSLQNIMAYFK
jgi:thioredoxin-related protein